jgi:hydrogenase maturation factor
MPWKEEYRKPKCHHFWRQVKREVNEEEDLVRFTHVCGRPGCGYIKTTVRKLNLKRGKP